MNGVLFMTGELRVKYLFLLGCSVVMAAPAWAGVAIPDREPIIVTATRTNALLSEVGQSVSVVTGEQIELSQASQAVDILARLPGVTVSPSGGFGQPTSVFVRGAENAQSLVLIDGVRLNDPADVGGGFDFGGLTISQFDRVEVVRGSQSVLWGSRAIGGVINFITRRPGGKWQGRVQADYGWRDRKQISASLTGMAGPIGLSLGGNWLQGDGYSVFSEDRGATERDRFESKAVNARADVELAAGLSLDAGSYYTKADYGYDDFGSDAAHTGSKRDATLYANLRYNGLDDRLNARIGFGLTDSNRLSNHAVFGPYITDGRNERFEGQVSFAPAPIVTLLIGAETEKSEFGDNFGSADTTRIDSVYGTINLRPVSGLTVNAGLRHDSHQDFGQKTSLSASGAWLLGENAPILRASYGEGFKAPSLYQLYTNTGFGALKPEIAKAYDIGIEQPFAAGRGKVSLTWFDRTTRNLIDFDFATFTYFNIGSTRSKGVEAAVEVNNWHGFDAQLSYTWLDAINQATGRQLARRPRHNLFASLDYAWSFGLRTGIDMRHGGRRFDDQANIQPVGEHTVFALRAAYAITDSVELFGRIENLFDETYEVVRTYGTPGRSVYGGVRARF
jgi:vitamin B12 transporter